MKVRIGEVILAGLVIWTATAGGMLVHTLYSRQRIRPAVSSDMWVRTDRWRSITDGGFRMGPERPIATIVVFSDFQCPYCRAFAARLDSLRKLHPDVQVIERQLPLVNLHEGAYKAALAAECSADIGKYEQLRHTMFQRQGLVEDQDWGLLAVSAGIKDTLKILDCITEELHKPEVDGDMKLAGQIGITGTPGIVVNGFVHEGAISLNELEKRLTIRPGN